MSQAFLLLLKYLTLWWMHSQNFDDSQLIIKSSLSFYKFVYSNKTEETQRNQTRHTDPHKALHKLDKKRQNNELE